MIDTTESSPDRFARNCRGDSPSLYVEQRHLECRVYVNQCTCIPVVHAAGWYVACLTDVSFVCDMGKSMETGLSLAGAGMVSREARHDALCENVANLSTPGYKATRVFSEVLRETQETAPSLQDVARAQKVYTDYSQGMIEPTGRDLDLALEGEGFFVIQTPDGERYTRNGNFSLDSQGRLATANGDLVLADSGPVTLEGGRLSVGADGLLIADGRNVGKLRIVNVTSPEALERAGHCQFMIRDEAAVQPAAATTTVRQASLERSNVEGIDEMVRMMTLLRQYEASQRAFKIQNDATRRVVNDLVQR